MNKFDFISGIKHLNTSSSLEEIYEYLLFDMKKLAILDKEKLYSKQDYFKNTNIILEYKDSNTEVINNWLRYKIATKLNLYTTNFDCDSTDVVKEVLLELLNPNVDSIRYDKKRGFTVNNEIKLETDTINSFATTFNKFMRSTLESYIEPSWVDNYMKKYNLSKPQEFYRDIYFLENINSWYEQMKDSDKEIFNQLKRLSVYAHTIGNFILVPKGYNKERYSETKDYWDLTLIDLKKNISKDRNFEWYTKNYHLFDLDTYFKKKTDEYFIEDNEPILLFGNHSLKQKIPRVQEIQECANSMELFIRIRGLDILKKLNSKLLNNEVFNNYYQELIDKRKEKIVSSKIYM